MSCPDMKILFNFEEDFGVQSFPKEKTKKHDDRKTKKTEKNNENNKEDLFSAKALTLNVSCKLFMYIHHSNLLNIPVAN